MGEPVARAPHLRVLYLSWRDRENPEAGGSETFVERTAEVLTNQGHDVTLFTSRFPGADRETRHDRVRVLRRGNRFTTYLSGLLHAARHRHDYDIVIDVQNGVPFWSPLAAKVPVVNVVHHVHRDQWHTFFPGPIAGLGWWLESRVAPRVYRKSRYVTVSEATREELAELGITSDRVDLIYSGNDQPEELERYAVLPRSPRPSIVVLGRLVPHKQVEVAIDVIAALRAAEQDVDLHIVGGGYWQDALEQHAAVRGVTDLVTMHGFVDEDVKHSLLASAWLVLMPSGKEGWGLTIVEAGLHATPTIAFHYAGGPRESIVDGVTGYLVDDVDEMTDRVQQLLADPTLRETLGANAREFAMSFDWLDTGTALEQTLLSVLGHAPRPVSAATSFRVARKDAPTATPDHVTADRQSSVA
ncbi:glycosyltransferase family 4 protein [Branchiibius sp. NY16-3462-2]|uniref:glycosyltransferase family 4 protein n=1 Tax=Branchiibius sp. NY16-3462-2 TaxID=1807500 RepID=UPI000B11AD72|nr:glycosyltransferase family 4 protein [Branchiibius sp. NY16-3462-2]